MSNRLPENEAEFRLVDPILEEYRQELRAYKVLLVESLCNQWLAEEKPSVALGDYLSRHIGDLIMSAMNHESFIATDFDPAVLDATLERICVEWQLPSLDELEREMLERYDQDLPAVYGELEAYL